MKSYAGSRFFLIATGEFKPDDLSGAIETIFKSNYSHIAIMVVPLMGDAFVFEATIPKAREVSLAECLNGDSEIRVQLEFTDRMIYSADYAVGHLRSKMGIDYGFDQFPGLATRLGSELGIGDNDLKRLVCSEFAAIEFEHLCGVDLWKNEDYVNPKECIEVATKFIKGEI